MNPNKIYQSLIETGSDWADKQAAHELLDGALKPLLAKLAIEAKETEKCSMAEAKEIALCASSYRDMLSDAIGAKQAAIKAKVRYDATKSLFEAQRSVMATERIANQAAT